jgi:hypothetical protein
MRLKSSHHDTITTTLQINNRLPTFTSSTPSSKNLPSSSSIASRSVNIIASTNDYIST